MGIFDKIKDALDGDDVEDAQKRVDEANKDAAEAKKDLDAAKAERKAEGDKDKNFGDALKEKLDEVKQDSKEAADKAKDSVKQDKGKAQADKQGKPKADKPAGDGNQTYTVKSGDTLSEIGAKYGVSYMDIARASGIDNPDLIFPGQVLTIPGK